MAWIYKQSTGEFSDAAGIWLGYSGAYGYMDPKWETMPDHGPIPCGDYTIGAAETHPRLGPVVMLLTPDEATAGTIIDYGRTPYESFYIHADNAATPGHSSSGCVVLGNAARQAIAASTDKQLQVIA